MRTALPIIKKTGNHVETWVIAPAMAIGAAVILYIHVAPKK
jgi:hypothetical protein